MLAYYVQFLIHQMETQETDDIIAEVDAEIFRFTQFKNMLLISYPDVLWIKALCYPQVYDEYLLNGTIMEGLAFQ